MAMIDAYKIGVELVLGGDLASGIEALIPGLTRLDGGLVQANATAKALAAALGSVAATAPGVGRVAEAMERLTVAMAAVNQAGHGLMAVAVPPGITGGLEAPAVRAAGGQGAVQARNTAGSTRPPRPDLGEVVPASAPADVRDRAATSDRLPQQAAAAQALAQAVQVATSDSAVGGTPETGSAPHGAVEGPGTVPVATALPAYAQDALRTDPGEVTAPSLAGPAPLGLALTGTDTPTVLPAQPAAAEGRTPMAPASVPTRLAPELGQGGAAPVQTVRAAKTSRAGPGHGARDSFGQIRDDVLPRVDGGARRPDADGPARRPRPAEGDRPLPPMTPIPAVAPLPVRLRVSAMTQAAANPAAPTKPTGTGWKALTESLGEILQGPGAASGKAATATEPGPAMTAFPERLRRDAADPLARRMSSPGPREARANARPHAAASTARIPGDDALSNLRSYHPQGGQSGPVIQHVTYVQLDERTIARAVTRQQLRMMGGQVSGTLRPDPSISPQYGAHLLEM